MASNANQQPIPADLVNTALESAANGTLPEGFDAESLSELLGLTGEEPDRLTLMQRFTTNGEGMQAFRSVALMMAGVKNLIKLTNEHGENEAQLAVALALGRVATSQIRREGDICPGARGMVLASTRDDIIAPETRALVSTEPTSAPEAAALEDARQLAQLVTGLLRALTGDMGFDEPRSPSGLWLPPSYRARRDPTEE